MVRVVLGGTSPNPCLGALSTRARACKRRALERELTNELNTDLAEPLGITFCEISLSGFPDAPDTIQRRLINLARVHGKGQVFEPFNTETVSVPILALDMHCFRCFDPQGSCVAAIDYGKTMIAIRWLRS
ncbi:hypothetical protein M378DRAFT_630141 [Amanita muscaria Koide BX008]|uniref:Uncharacterized protein n=1 Tax=Amanita muscaria (strain Koide BX008) TaxID=946122 RepID=A0A0C2X4P1_AMAMK|nr:hypothetical protein M378DRAFT_630141 [Amanita muscaria Koide BX008]